MARGGKQREREGEGSSDEPEAGNSGGKAENYPGPRPDEWAPEKAGEGPDLEEERAPNRPSGTDREHARPKSASERVERGKGTRRPSR